MMAGMMQAGMSQGNGGGARVFKTSMGPGGSFVFQSTTFGGP